MHALFKDHLQSEKAKPALLCKAKKSKLLDPPGEMLSTRTYANTEFVNIIVKKPLYEKIEKFRSGSS